MDVRKLRKTARLTQIELAQQTRISRVRLSFAECGYLKLTQKELTLIQKVIARELGRRAARIRAAVETAPKPRHLGTVPEVMPRFASRSDDVVRFAARAGESQTERRD